MQQMLVVACEWAPDLCLRKLRQWRLERQRFLTRPSTCHWSSHSRGGWGADGVDKVKEPRRNQTLSFSLLSDFFHTLPAFHIFLSLAVSVFCSHIAVLRCSIEPVIPRREIKFANCSYGPTTHLLSFALHPTCLTLNIPCSIFKMLSLLFALSLSS